MCAWLSLGEQRAAVHDWSGAVESARAGLQELGKLFGFAARLREGDDSTLYIGAAEDEFKVGHIRAAAKGMLEMLQWRTRLYVRYYADEIAE